MPHREHLSPLLEAQEGPAGKDDCMFQASQQVSLLSPSRGLISPSFPSSEIWKRRSEDYQSTLKEWAGRMFQRERRHWTHTPRTKRTGPFCTVAEQCPERPVREWPSHMYSSIVMDPRHTVITQILKNKCSTLERFQEFRVKRLKFKSRLCCIISGFMLWVVYFSATQISHLYIPVNSICFSGLLQRLNEMISLKVPGTY